MLARTTKKRKVSIAVALFFLVSVFLAFGVFGNELSDDSDGGDVSQEEPVEQMPLDDSVSDEPEVSVESDSGEVYLSIDGLIEDEEEIVEEEDNSSTENNSSESFDEVPVNETEVFDGNETVEGNETDSLEFNETDELYLDIEEVVGDENEETSGDVKSVRKLIGSGGSSGDEGEKDAAVDGVEDHEPLVDEETTEEAELSESLSLRDGVNVGGEYMSGKEIMKVKYSKIEEDIVEKIKELPPKTVIVDDGKELRKRVVVSSGGEHFTGDIIYNSYLEREVESKDQIRVDWISKGQEIDFEVSDDNGNGLIDKVSWTIPHLSVQEFEVTVLFDVVESNSSTLELEVIAEPEENVSVGDNLVFDFNVSYYDVSLVSCNFSVFSEDVLVLEETGESMNHSLSLANGNYDWNVVCFDVTNESIWDDSSGSFVVGVDYSPLVSLDSNLLSIQTGETVNFDFNVSVPLGVPSSISYELDYGDGEDDGGSNYSIEELSGSESHTYDSAGSFEVVLSGTVQYEGGEVYSSSDALTITVSEPQPEGDTEGPDIELVEPDDNKLFKLDSREDKIKFSYTVTDNVKISNCTFEMFYYNDSIFGEEIITEFKSDISNGSTISYEYKDFDEGDYSWDVECYDNSSNRGSVSDRDFSVGYVDDDDSDSSSSSNKAKVKTLSAEEQEDVDEVQDLIDAINDFFVAEERFDPIQTDALEDLEMDDALKFYKKKLLQMKLDLQHNLEYIDANEKRDERRAEIIDEIERIRREIPVSFEVAESTEFFKNSLELDFEEVMKAYADAKGLVADNRVIRKMAEQNELLQNQIAVSTSVKEVSIEYLDGDEDDFVLVSKEIDFKSKDFDSLLEVIPGDVVSSAGEVSFIVEPRILREQGPIFEIDLDALGNREKLVYRIDRAVTVDTLETTTTLAFKENIPESTIGGVTGFVSFVGADAEGGIWFYVSWILAIAGLFVVGSYSYKKIRIGRLKKHKDVRALFAITSETEKLLRKKEIELARQKYQEAQAIYPKIPEHGKRIAYKKLQKLYVAIDRKDIVSMVKEFMTASKDGRKNDALMIYGDIQKLYPRMPTKFKQKVFEKMKPHLDRLK